MTKRKPKFAIGDTVYITYAKDHTLYEITRLFPGNYGCFIRQTGIAPNGKTYSEQRFDVGLLTASPKGGA